MSEFGTESNIVSKSCRVNARNIAWNNIRFVVSLQECLMMSKNNLKKRKHSQPTTHEMKTNTSDAIRFIYSKLESFQFSVFISIPSTVQCCKAMYIDQQWCTDERIFIKTNAHWMFNVFKFMWKIPCKIQCDYAFSCGEWKSSMQTRPPQCSAASIQQTLLEATIKFSFIRDRKLQSFLICSNWIAGTLFVK